MQSKSQEKLEHNETNQLVMASFQKAGLLQLMNNEGFCLHRGSVIFFMEKAESIQNQD